MTLADRFWAKVQKTATCWLWIGSHIPNGYGNFWTGSRVELAHRVSYENAKGPIPEGLTLDHLCRNRSCVNPEHLEPVTNRENMMRSPIQAAAVHSRKTHCRNGHLFDTTNTARNALGWRRCKSCTAASSRKSRRLRRERELAV